MPTYNRLTSLEQRHMILENKLADELKRPSPNSNTVRTIKKEKLKIKDEMMTLQRTASNSGSSSMTIRDMMEKVGLTVH